MCYQGVALLAYWSVHVIWLLWELHSYLLPVRSLHSALLTTHQACPHGLHPA